MWMDECANNLDTPPVLREEKREKLSGRVKVYLALSSSELAGAFPRTDYAWPFTSTFFARKMLSH